MAIKLSDYVAKELVKHGVRHVFMISGGGAMHLNDSLGKNENLEYVCNHHEQASAIAAEGYARASGKLAVVNVTTGPGGVNALNGVFGQWTDSVPVLYISGQVKHETTLDAYPNLGLRQLGDQEVDIISMVKPITKYAIMLKNPQDVAKVLGKAIYLATHGRKGPTWIDIPINIQGAMIDEDALEQYDPTEDEIKFNQKEISNNIAKTIELLQSAKRPIIVAGHGIKLANARGLFLDFINQLKIPVVTTINGFDLVPSDNNFFAGRIGTVGQRAGNFALQNADLVLFLGTRNNIRQVSYSWEFYAKKAIKVVVDIDEAELRKPTLNPDVPICCDAGKFMSEFLSTVNLTNLPNYNSWVKWCKERQKKYHPVPTALDRKENAFIEPYKFMETLSKAYRDGEVSVSGNGTAFLVLFQAGIVKNNQNIFWNSGNASMGYDLPASIGACFANDKKDVVCIAGDGSIMMNLQELQTIRHYNLPIKLFILNNDGYSSIRQTQRNFFGEKLVACSGNSGVSTPDFVKVAKSFGLPSCIIKNDKNLKGKISKVLDSKGPMVCEVLLDHDYIFQPKLSAEKLPDGRIISKPLEDMYPFLDREEFESNIIKN